MISNILQLQTTYICIFVLIKLYLKGRSLEVLVWDQKIEYMTCCYEILANHLAEGLHQGVDPLATSANVPCKASQQV